MSKGAKGRNGGSSRVYKSYLFKTKDPVIDQLRTLVQKQHGSLKHAALKKVELAGGPTVSCMAAWFFGATLRPNNCSTEAAGRAMGFKREWVPMK